MWKIIPQTILLTFASAATLSNLTTPALGSTANSATVLEQKQQSEKQSHDAIVQLNFDTLNALFSLPPAEDVKAELGLNPEEQLQELINAAPKEPSAENIYRLGIAYEVTGSYARAASLMEQALQKQPDQIVLYRELVQIYKKQQPKTVTLFINGHKMESDSKSQTDIVIQNGNTLVPIRAFSEQLGATVKWNQVTKTAEISLRGTEITLVLDSNEAIVNGHATMLDVPAQEIGARIMVPLRFVSERLQMNVNYFSAIGGTSIIKVQSKGLASSPLEETFGQGSWHEQYTSLQKKQSDLSNKLSSASVDFTKNMERMFDQISPADLMRVQLIQNNNRELYQMNQREYDEYYQLLAKQRSGVAKQAEANKLQQLKKQLTPVNEMIKTNLGSIQDVLVRVHSAKDSVRQLAKPILPLLDELQTWIRTDQFLRGKKPREWDQNEKVLEQNNTEAIEMLLEQLFQIKQEIYQSESKIYDLLNKVNSKITELKPSQPSGKIESSAPSSPAPIPSVTPTLPSTPSPVEGDQQVPTTPGGLVAAAVSDTQINLQWSAATDNVGVTGYELYRDGVKIQTLDANSLSYQDTGLTAQTSYSYTIKARDAAGNLSSASLPATAATQAPPVVPDTEVPSAPTGLTAVAKSDSEIDLSWSASTDNVGVAGYEVYRNGQPVGSTNAGVMVYSDMSLTNGTTYSYTIRAKDAAGNLSADSNVASATTVDTQAPSAPAGVTAEVISSSQIKLSWLVSTDNRDVEGYDVYRNGVLIGSTQAGVLTFEDSGLVYGTTYSYTVQAKDGAGNLSWMSSPISTTIIGVFGKVYYGDFNWGNWSFTWHEAEARELLDGILKFQGSSSALTSSQVYTHGDVVLFGFDQEVTFNKIMIKSAAPGQMPYKMKLEYSSTAVPTPVSIPLPITPLGEHTGYSTAGDTITLDLGTTITARSIWLQALTNGSEYEPGATVWTVSEVRLLQQH